MDFKENGFEVLVTELIKNGNDDLFGDRILSREFDDFESAKNFYDNYNTDKHCLVSLFDWSKDDDNAELDFKIF